MAPTTNGPPTAGTAAARPAAGEGPIFLLDGNSLLFRAFFAVPTDLATTAGLVTNAVHGFTSMVVNLIRDHRPSGMAAAWDRPEATFREEVVPTYKGNRPDVPDLLAPQFELARRVLAALAVPCLEMPGYEADDILATLADEARHAGRKVIVVTGDRDTFQLVEDPWVRVMYTRRGISDVDLYDEAGIVDRTGVAPRLYPLLASLRGDPSDNLPGVPGVGEKTAAKLVTTYGDLDAVFAHAAEQTPKLAANLAAAEAQVRANAEVIPLVRDVPLDVHLADLVLGGWDPEAVRAVFEQLELRTVWGRLAPLLEEAGAGPVGGRDGALGRPPGAPDLEAALAALVVTAPGDAADAVAALDGLAGRVAPGAEPPAVVALWPRYAGVPGRSAVTSLAVAAVTLPPEPAGDGADADDATRFPPAAVVLDGSLLADAAVGGALARLVTGPAPRVVGHDLKELMRVLLPAGVDISGLRLDVAVAAYLLDPAAGDYDLDDLVATFLGAALEGGPVAPEPAAGQLALDVGTHDDDGASEGDTDAAHVSARRAAAVGILEPVLRGRLRAAGLERLHDTVERPLERVLARMEVAGVAVDVDELKRLFGELTSEARALEAEIHRHAGGEFNVNSTPQLRTVLYDKLHLEPGRKTKTGYSTNAATLERLRGVHPIIDALLRYREVEKLRSTYGEGLIAEVAADGRIHASFNQTVARTGRLSSDRPNLHNIPVRTDEGRRIRRAFVPAAGCRLLVSDYDQIELRVIAHLSGDPGLVAAFAEGRDIHRTTAARVFGVAPEDVTVLQRSRAKMVSYGLAYGMESYGLGQRLGIPTGEAQEILDAYFDAFPSVRAYMNGAVAEARSHGYTETLFGRRRPLPDLHSLNRSLRMAAERQAMNAGIQGLAADLFKVALVRLDAALEDGGHASRLVLQVHDEVIVEVPAAEEDAVGALVPDVLSGVGDEVGLSVPLEVSTSWGDSWADAKG